MTVANENSLVLARYLPEHRAGIAQVLANVGWEQRYIDGQLGAVDAFAGDPENAGVFVALQKGQVTGYISIQRYAWNRLAQIHGLVVDPSARRQGVAARLVEQAEQFAINTGCRGVYVDTPVTNTGARAFYLSQGYRQDYIMTAYYDTDLDGVTYLKLFTSTNTTSPE